MVFIKVFFWLPLYIYLGNQSINKSQGQLLFDLCKNDQRTKLCKNLSNIANETFVDKLSLNKSLVKSNMIYANPAENARRIPLLKDLLLLLIRSNQNVLEGFNYDEIDVIIDDICKN